MTNPIYNAVKGTTPFHIFKSLVCEAAGLAISDLHNERIHAAYEMGEPVWMVADEMKHRATKPVSMLDWRKIAVRHVKF